MCQRAVAPLQYKEREVAEEARYIHKMEEEMRKVRGPRFPFPCLFVYLSVSPTSYPAT